MNLWPSRGRVDGVSAPRYALSPRRVDGVLGAYITQVTKASPTEIQLVLKDKQRWPVGVLYVTQITCGDKTKRTFANGQGVGVATVLRDPVVDAHPELKLYGTHSKRLVVRGSGFSPDGTSLTLEPTRAAKYSVIEATEWSVTLELKSEGAWCDDLKDDKGVERYNLSDKTERYELSPPPPTETRPRNPGWRSRPAPLQPGCCPPRPRRGSASAWSAISSGRPNGPRRPA